jgi:hypothetical protein
MLPVLQYTSGDVIHKTQKLVSSSTKFKYSAVDEHPELQLRMTERESLGPIRYNLLSFIVLW